MSLESFVGRQINSLDEQPKNNFGLKLPHPIMTMDDIERLRAARHPDIKAGHIDALFPSQGEGHALEKALEDVFQQAVAYIGQGYNLLILSDRRMDSGQAAIPSLLVVSGLHHHLIANGLRNMAGIIIESGEPREVMHFALLMAFGADAICPYLAFETVRDLAESTLLEKPQKAEEAMDAYITAIKKGLLKTFSRMGISTLHSFFASQIFEAVGLSRVLVDRYFCGTPSRMNGVCMKWPKRPCCVIVVVFRSKVLRNPFWMPAVIIMCARAVKNIYGVPRRSINCSRPLGTTITRSLKNIPV